MESGSDQPSWYLVFTKPRCEHVANKHLRDQGFETYLPLFNNRRQQRFTALFPSYLFIRLNTMTDNWSPIRSTPGVSRMVRFGVLPAQVPDVVIDALKARETESGMHAVAAQTLAPGDRVRVLDGPMAGLEAVYNMPRGSERALILLDLLGKMSRVELEIESLEKA